MIAEILFGSFAGGSGASAGASASASASAGAGTYAGGMPFSNFGTGADLQNTIQQHIHAVQAQNEVIQAQIQAQIRAQQQA